MTAAAYRFLPWSRRGLSTAIPPPAAGADLPQRATIKAGLTVSHVGSAEIDLTLYGPGDVIGIDPRLIIRTDPKPYSTDTEPNYLASIEFDLPEFPWLFTPAAAGPDGRLMPWLALVVLTSSGPNGVGPPRAQPGRPLPCLDLSAQQIKEELPDLAGSWAWAHSQLLVERGAGGSDRDRLAGDPALNLSRIVCPRRLQPSTGYVACLVPAFDAGVVRGTGGEPAEDAALGPAWDVANPASRLVLPVYYHWEFATGAEGDFESLARRLKPIPCPADVGTTAMHIWHGLPGLEDAPQASRDRKVLMDSALRATEGEPPAFSDIDAAFTRAIAAEVNAPADIADSSAPDSTRAIAAPLYGGAHLNRARVPTGEPDWLRELNLDPRARAAAGLGADVVRANQEAFMQACWEQAGKVLEANALLNQARLSMDALDRLFQRLRALPPAEQLSIAGPLDSRIPFADRTLAASIARSSLPDAILSANFRRQTSARRPAVRLAARRLAQPDGRVQLIERMAAGQASVDPNRAVPDGIAGLRSLDRLDAAGRGGGERVSLAPLGLPIEVPRAEVDDRPRGDAGEPGPFRPRPDLGSAGLLTGAHVRATRELLAASPQPARFSTAFDALGKVAAASPRAEAFLLETESGSVRAAPIDLHPAGTVVVRTPDREPDRILAVLGAHARRSGRADLARSLGSLPAGTFGRRAAEVVLERNAGGDLVPLDRRGVPTRRGPDAAGTKTVEPLLKAADAIDRAVTAFGKTAELLALNVADPPLQTVGIDLGAAAEAAAVRLEPRRNVRARIATMVEIGGDALGPRAGNVAVPPTVDRILVGPELPEPAYLRLALHDPAAFLCGIDEIPLDSVTLLETNPRFVEAFMVGLNHEMNRELLWRSFPTDQRGTPFQHFWDWFDDAPDIGKIHAFAADRPLGHNSRGGAEGGNLVLLVRGQLLRRYPNSIISAWRSDASGKLMANPGPGDHVPAAFFGSFPPDTSFAGFALTREQIVDGHGWFFVIEQQLTEPRFGFDEDSATDVAAIPTDWLDARWIDAGTEPGKHLAAGASGGGARLGGVTVNGVEYGRDAAHMAAVMVQRPFRLAVHARHLMNS